MLYKLRVLLVWVWLSCSAVVFVFSIFWRNPRKLTLNWFVIVTVQHPAKMENTAVAGASVLAWRNCVTMKQIAMMHQMRTRRTAVSVGLLAVVGKITHYARVWGKRGRVVNAWDSQFSGPVFESRFDHYLDVFTELRVQILGHTCK